MTDSSARLGLPYIVESQSQKEVTHNAALDRLDGAVQLAVLDRDLTAPPATPASGAAYIVAATASGAWSGHDGEIALYANGWQFLTPAEGWLAWVADEDVLLRHTGSGWTVFASATGQAVMAAADAAAGRAALGLSIGIAPGDLVQLDTAGKLPAVDGSQLLNLPGGGGAISLDGLTDVDTTTAPPSDGQALVWSATSSLWRPGSVASGGTSGGVSLLLSASGDGATTAFTLSASPTGAVMVFVGGVLQTNTSLSGTSLTFDAAPPSGAPVLVYGGSGGFVALVSASGDGSSTAFTLSATPSGAIVAFVGGVLQTNTTLSGTSLSFDAPPPSGAAVIVYG